MRRCIRNAAGTEVWCGDEGEDGQEDYDDGNLELGWRGVQDAARTAKSVTAGERRSSSFAEKFASVAAKCSTEEGQRMLKSGSQYQECAAEVLEERTRYKIDKLSDQCQLAVAAEAMESEPCKIYTCDECQRRDFRPLACAKKEPHGQSHSLAVKSGFKYWFECQLCRNRDASLLKLAPGFDCNKCGGSRWKRSTKASSRGYVSLVCVAGIKMHAIGTSEMGLIGVEELVLCVVCVRAYVRACVRACVRVCSGQAGE